MPQARILIGDVRERLAEIPDGSVRTCITSPPYFGLRDYGTGEWQGGSADCDHIAPPTGGPSNKGQREKFSADGQYKNTCRKCGAERVDSQIGLEQTPDEYVANLVAVFTEIRRVLADDGTVWLNLGDSYFAKPKSNYDGKSPGLQSKNYGTGDTTLGYKQQADKFKSLIAQGYKNKDLMGIPWRVAFALQQDGWYLRQDIIWAKPNPMPEPAKDRFVKSHEYVFLLSKSPRYFFDHIAVQEKAIGGGSKFNGSPTYADGDRRDAGRRNTEKAEMRNKRDVWTINTKPFKGAHFAVMPEALVEPCLLAGTSEKGKCSECGKPWVRMVKKTRIRRTELDPSDNRYRPNTYTGAYEDINGKGDAGYSETETLGWEATCECDAEIVPDVVLDPFTGSGTVAVVAMRYGRNFVGTELNPEYGEIALKRISDADPLFNQVELE